MVLLGMGNKFEIWNESTLAKRRQEEEMNLGDTASDEMRNLVL
jgi:DNA-binding transcriptional regulator/RsmH inhibitor MraZ